MRYYELKKNVSKSCGMMSSEKKHTTPILSQIFKEQFIE